MSADGRENVERLCLEALSKDGAERAAFLDHACGDDAALRREVESLLAGPSNAAAFLDTPAWGGSADSLAAGTRLGPYEILGAIGAGGMGEVYKARDTRLGRVVAIKVLPREFAADPDRRARFERESKIIAALSHPHICALFDVGREVPTQGEGKAEDAAEARRAIDFLVMEYLEGRTLAARLENGRLPLDEALDLATQIADALAASHRQGVIHRDLKPANVMLVKAPGGRRHVEAKLLDFGLAKQSARGDQAVGSPLTSAVEASLTVEGQIAGTFRYMSPEQLEGQPADVRSDIWALGAIIYEMVTGKSPFDATSTPGLVAAILERHPSRASAVQPSVSPALDRLIERCLAKEPAGRWDSAHDVADELRWISEAASLPKAGATRPGHRRRWIAAAVAGTLAVAALLGWLLTRPRGAAELSATRLTTDPGEEGEASFSPDGTKIAFTWSRQGNADIYVKQIGSAGPAMPLTSSPAAETTPAWSPDDRWIAFVRRQSSGQLGDVVLVSRSVVRSAG